MADDAAALGATASVVAVVPARAGSKGVPGKNLRRVGGVPLVARAIETTRRVPSIGRTIVSSDGDEILEVARRFGADVHRRPDRLAGDTASSESALLDVLGQLGSGGAPLPEIVVFVQCTSPFIDPADVDAAIGRVSRGDADVVFAAAPSHAFLWRLDRDGAHGVNHDSAIRLRRQDREPEFVETGAFYVMRTSGFLAAEHRFFGRIELQVCDPVTAHEIDDEHDLLVARSLATLVDPLRSWPAADDVDLVVTDFDGVHTDNTARVDENGAEAVRVDRSDGLGISMLRQRGLPLLILSTEQNEVVRRRAEKLGVECISACDDKLAALVGIASERGIPAERIVYLGNDVNDRSCLDWVGWPIVVADAHPDVVGLARCVTQAPGGGGAVRELIDRLLGASPAID